jgi:hypothetical protein
LAHARIEFTLSRAFRRIAGMHRGLRLTFFAIAATAAAFGQRYFPHVTWGGGWQMTIRVVNLDSSTAAAATLSFYDDDENRLSAPVGGTRSAAA